MKSKPITKLGRPFKGTTSKTTNIRFRLPDEVVNHPKIQQLKKDRQLSATIIQFLLSIINQK